MERMTPNTIDFNSLSKKQLVELVIAKYNDCFRLEEENKKLDTIIENTKIEQEADRKHIEELEQENKNLKLIQETNEKQIQNDIKERDELREENKKLYDEIRQRSMHFENDEVGCRKRECKRLNIKVASLEGEIKGLNSVIEKLNEENQTLELWLDRKEKLNGKYRKEIDNKKLSTIAEETIQDLQDRIKELIGKIDQLEEENENLRKDLFHKTNNGKAK